MAANSLRSGTRHDEYGFASMYIYHVTNGTPIAAILLSTLKQNYARPRLRRLCGKEYLEDWATGADGARDDDVIAFLQTLSDLSR